MGIKSLTKLLMDMAPKAVKEVPLKQLMGRKLAIDASNFIYQVQQAGAPATVKDRTQHPWRMTQFLVAVRATLQPFKSRTPEYDDLRLLSHLQGMLSRTIRLLESGVKPLFVFDGKPPKMKEEEIAKRRAAREAAEKDMATAVESGTVADIEKFSKRTIVMTKQHQEDCKKLLALMGMPVVTAPCEAEAQCAELAAGGVVWGVASEDMDTLTFAAPNLVRRITASASRNQAPLHFNLAEALKGLGLTQAQFVDMCILCGSDYTKKTIAGVGPKTAHKLVKSEGSMEGVLAKVAADKLPPPEDFNWREARELFLHHEVLPHTEVEAKWGDADEQGVVDFLVGEKGFNEDRVRSALKRLKKARKVGNQKRMDSFFGGGAKKDPFAAAAASKPLKSTAATSEPLKSTAAAAAAAPAAAGAGGSATGGRGTKRRITSTSSQSRKK